MLSTGICGLFGSTIDDFEKNSFEKYWKYYLLEMDKLKKDEILVTRFTKEKTRIRFFQVIRSTSNTCEIRELRKKIVSQSHEDQQVVPVLNEFVSAPTRNKVQKNGSVKIQDFLYAWPWDGTPAWQTVIIFMP